MPGAMTIKLGLVARPDNSGLGIQTWEFQRHMKPDKTLVIDLSELADAKDNCNKHAYLDRFPGALVHRGLTPTPDVITEFLDGLDVIFSAETFYTHDLLHRANSSGVKSVLQYNYEFLTHLTAPSLPRPTLFAAPSLWRYFTTNLSNKVHLPVPIATERFSLAADIPEVAQVFMHPVGRPAIYDRNGTHDLIAALPYIRNPVTIIFRCQRSDYVEPLLKKADIPAHLNIEVDTSAPADYWVNYQGVDAVILPRRYGGLCLPANESLGAGIPILMPDIDPNNHWLPMEWLMPASIYNHFEAANSVSVYQTKPAVLADYVDAFATDSSLYSRSVAEARRLARCYSWDALLDQYHATLRRAVDAV